MSSFKPGVPNAVPMGTMAPAVYPLGAGEEFQAFSTKRICLPTAE